MAQAIPVSERRWQAEQDARTLAVHDWDRAIKDEWVEKTLNKIQPFKLLYEEERIGLNTLTKFFRKE